MVILIGSGGGSSCTLGIIRCCGIVFLSWPGWWQHLWAERVYRYDALRMGHAKRDIRDVNTGYEQLAGMPVERMKHAAVQRKNPPFAVLPHGQ
jgi:hypothetical protein